MNVNEHLKERLQDKKLGIVSTIHVEGTADGAIEVAEGGASVPAVVFVADVMFDGCGFMVTGIPHIFDSVVLTGLSFDNGLFGLHIISFCSGVNDVSFVWP